MWIIRGSTIVIENIYLFHKLQRKVAQVTFLELHEAKMEGRTGAFFFHLFLLVTKFTYYASIVAYTKESNLC